MLSYKDYTMKHLTCHQRSVKYANGELLFAFTNKLVINVDKVIDVRHICLQADIASRQIMQHRSDFDLKRFLGPNDSEWQRMLHTAYVYDHIRCYYYGMKSPMQLKVPEGIFAFPGHALMAEMLVKKDFLFQTDDSQPYQVLVQIKTEKTVEENLEDVFQIYPCLRDGLSTNPEIVSYVNTDQERIMRGLMNAMKFIQSKKGDTQQAPFTVVELSDNGVKKYTDVIQNPIANSFLSKDGKKFYFYLSDEANNPGGINYNESIFIARAMGMRSDPPKFENNSYYYCANRVPASDRLTREDVYSITGLKSNELPYTPEDIQKYLGSDTYNTIPTNILLLFQNSGSGGNSAVP